MVPADEDVASVAAPVVTAAERAKLAAVFTADGARERARGLRRLLVGVLAVLGLPLWAAAVWRVPEDVRRFAVAAFAAAALGAALAVVWEWRWRRARSSRIADLGPLPFPSRRAAAEARDACARPADEES